MQVARTIIHWPRGLDGEFSVWVWSEYGVSRIIIGHLDNSGHLRRTREPPCSRSGSRVAPIVTDANAGKWRPD